MPNITLGQYISENSFIHKLDPRTKILLSFVLMITIVISWSYLSMIIITLLDFLIIIFSSINIKTYIKSSKFIFVMAIFSFILNLFYGVGEPIFRIGFMSITESGIQNGILVIVRLLNLMIVSMCLMFTTSPNDMTYAIERFLNPLKRFNINTDDITMMLTIAIRFLPTTFDEATKLINAQKSRGADMYNKNLVKRAKSFVPVIIPLILSSFRRAYELSTAMECRCYGIATNNRTKMKELKIGFRDIFASIFVLFIFMVVIICNTVTIPNILKGIF